MPDWMKKAFSHNPGALHRQLGYPPNRPLPPALIRDIVRANKGTHVRGYKVTELLKQRALAAYNARIRKK